MNANLTTTEAPALTLDDAGRQVALIEDGKQQCSCSDNCSGRTTRFFSQGHDARLVTRLRNAVTAGDMTTAEAFAEILKRGGTERLQIKLDAAVANARNPRAKKSRKARKAAPIETFEMDGFQLQTPPTATDPARAKVGRWTYEGTLRTHQSAEEGAEKSDTFLVFEFTNKSGELVETLKFREAERLAEVPEGDAAAEAAPEEVAELPSLVGPTTTSTGRVTRPIPNPGSGLGDNPFEARADEETADIPF
jgi:hypothetical protein